MPVVNDLIKEHDLNGASICEVCSAISRPPAYKLIKLPRHLASLCTWTGRCHFFINSVKNGLWKVSPALCRSITMAVTLNSRLRNLATFFTILRQLRTIYHSDTERRDENWFSSPQNEHTRKCSTRNDYDGKNKLPPYEAACGSRDERTGKKMKLRFMIIKKSLCFHGGKFNSNL